MVGLGALLLILGNRLSDESRSPKLAGTETLRTIQLPPGASVLNLDLYGDQVALHLVYPDGKEEIVLYTIATGKRLDVLVIEH